MRGTIAWVRRNWLRYWTMQGAPSKPSRLLLLSSLAALALAACAGVRVRTDYDESIDFSRLRSYGWLEPPVVEAPASETDAPDPFERNSLLDQRVRQAVDRELAARGFAVAEEDPAFRLQYHVVLRDRTRIRPSPGAYYGGRYGYYGGVFAGSTSYDYQEGTLIIDFIDARTGRIAWRGWAVGTNREGYYAPERIDESVRKILAEFPPGRAQ